MYINRQTGKEIYVNLVKYHVYQQLKADEHQPNLKKTMATLMRGEIHCMSL